MFLFHFTGVYSPEFERDVDFVVHLMDTLELVKEIRFVESLQWHGMKKARSHGMAQSSRLQQWQLHCKMRPICGFELKSNKYL